MMVKFADGRLENRDAVEKSASIAFVGCSKFPGMFSIKLTQFLEH